MQQGTKSLLTVRTLESLLPGEWAADPAARGAGRLQVRKLANGELAWYYRYTAPDGERVRQLARLTTADFDRDSHSVRLRDIKGRRSVARLHDVPLIAEVERELETLRGDAGNYLFSLTRGLSPVHYENLRDQIINVRTAMEKAGELEKVLSRFVWKRC